LVFLIVTTVSFGIAIFLYLGKRAVRQVKPAIAILPFRNLSADAGDQHFSDGLTIELIESLTRIESLKVVSWSSASRFRGKAKSLEELRTQLNAAAVLDGSVRQQGEKLHVTAQLVDTAKGNTLWSQTWDREMKDVFRIQEELAKSIVFGLRVQMSADPDQVLVPPKATNPEVYSDYLLARYHRNTTPKEGMRLSSEYANKALARDPNYAPPYALLAMNMVLGSYYDRVPGQEATTKAKDLASQAIKLDPKSAEGHSAYGAAVALGEWKFAEARNHLLKAIQINPGSAEARAIYVLAYLLPMAMLNDAEWEVRRSLDLDPLSFRSNFLAGYVVLLTPGRESEALTFYDKALEIDPASDDVVWDRGMALAFGGRKEEAIAAFRKRAELHQMQEWTCAPVECALLREKDKAQDRLKANQNNLDSIETAQAYSLMGRSIEALDHLNLAFRNRNRQLMFVNVDRRLTNLRGNPGFQKLLKRIGLEQ
jgi:TolB-like protein/Tfp pilus assembly protein PilF